MKYERKQRKTGEENSMRREEEGAAWDSNVSRRHKGLEFPQFFFFLLSSESLDHERSHYAR